MTDGALTPETFARLRDLLAARFGLAFADDAREGFARRVAPRLAATGAASYEAYRRRLAGDPADPEWDEIAELVTTRETYFYRDEAQLRSFAEEVLPLVAEGARGRRRLAFWSAGCSTGEEAYTIAMVVLDALDRLGLAGWDVRVFGSDVSKRAIATARRGVYGGASFRALPRRVRARRFVEIVDANATPGARDGGEARVDERVRSICRFAHENLLAGGGLSTFRPDVVFCRNVLIYMTPDARRSILRLVYERLAPGGVLCLGRSESLLHGDLVGTGVERGAFELLHLEQDLAYRKPTFRDPEAPPKP